MDEKQMDDQFKSYLESSVTSLLNTVKTVAKYGSATEDVNTFTAMMADICTAEHRSMRHDAALEIAKKEKTVEAFEKVFHTEIAKTDDFKPENTGKYNDFKAKVEAILSAGKNKAKTKPQSHSENADCIMESYESHIDPLTKLHIFNPVVNKHCGHYYEKFSIMEAMEVNPNIRCPVIACPNKKPICKEHLAEDEELKDKLESISRQAGNED